MIDPNTALLFILALLSILSIHRERRQEAIEDAVEWARHNMMMRRG